MIDMKEYFQFLGIPSISTDPKYAADTRKCGLWVEEKLKRLGFKTEIWETEMHPIVFASYFVSKDKPTLLIYNHYDVQPVDPLPEWNTPPFEPVLKDGIVYARGAQDNKGQCFYVLEALRQIKEKNGTFPLNIKVIVEGEEECGSKSLPKVLEAKKESLKADYLAVVDMGIPAADIPAVTLGMRGMVTMDMEVSGCTTDVHSGCQGGMVYNPIHAITKLLADARNADGSITIPGFYDSVVPLTSEELKKITFDFDEKQFVKDFGVLPTGGENKLLPLERAWLRPTFEINGIYGGYTGEGFKTVIPAKAYAKMSCRLVLNQDPVKIGKLVKEYFESKAPPGIKVKVNVHPGGGIAARSNPSSEGVKAFSKAYTEIFGKPCRFILEGATIPIIPKLVQASQAEPVLIGLGLVTDKIHAPNEHFSVERLEKGAKIMVRALEILGGQ